MILDIFFICWLLFSLIEGYKKGLIKTLLSAIGYIAGGFAALYLVINDKQTQWTIPAIFIGVAIGSWIGHALDRALKFTVVRGPLALLNSLAGSAVDGAKVFVAFYVIATVLLWLPWSAGHSEVLQSHIYKAIDAKFETL